MGYHRDEVKTKEAFEDGWFKSGDLGKLDEDQFLWMSGRLKELIITAGGENIAPIPIENNIKAELSDIVSYVIGKVFYRHNFNLINVEERNLIMLLK